MPNSERESSSDSPQNLSLADRLASAFRRKKAAERLIKQGQDEIEVGYKSDVPLLRRIGKVHKAKGLVLQNPPRRKTSK